MYDRIYLRDIRAVVAVGATAAERQRPQEVRIDAELAVEMSGARRFDRLVATVDYAALHARILATVSSAPCALLEHLAQRLLDALTNEPLVRWAEVEIAKPDFLAGATPSVRLRGRRPTRVAIGLGANLGDAPAALSKAIGQMESIGPLLARSSLYRSKPWGVLDQPDFYNAAVILETTLLPHAVLAALQAIEARGGRTPGARFGPRRIDCDLLDDEGMRISDAELTVPHPRLEERAFVLAPLAEIEPRYRAAYGRLAESERAAVVRLAEWRAFDANAPPS